MKYDLVIFDLDGTILDTLDDLAAACNHAMRTSGCPERTREEVRTFVGSGVAKLIERALPSGSSPDLFNAALAEFRTYYSSHLKNHTAPYDGIPELMRALRDAGIHVAVNSNKPDAATRALCETVFPELVERSIGERPGIPKKPAPNGALDLIEAFSAAPKRTLYVGDSNIDLLTAQNAGLDCAWVSWGFRRRSELEGLTVDHAFDSVKALKNFILS